jgi:hypothetical protein
VFWWGNVRERGNLGDPGIDGRMILRWIFRKWDVVFMDWIKLAQAGDRWRTLVSTLLALEDGTDRGFRNVGTTKTDFGDTPKRTPTVLKTRRKPEIKIIS